MVFWNFKKPTESEQHRAFAGMYLILAVLFTLIWVRDPARWQFGLFATGNVAVAILHLWRLRIRFTISTLLFATTLVAVGLGLIVWLASAR